MNPAPADIEMHSQDDQYMADDEYDNHTEDHLQKNTNVRELEMLCREIDHLMAQGISPPESWYEKRYINLQVYSELGWSSMAYRFQRMDRYIENTSMNIMNNLEDLLEEYHQKGHFHLRHYQHAVHDIQDLWNYYKTTYIGDESDPDVGDLIAGLTHMMSNL
jgi:hypothetical protein